MLATTSAINLSSFNDGLRVAVVGASGGVGKAFVEHFCQCPAVNAIDAFSRSSVGFSDEKVRVYALDVRSESSIEAVFAEMGSEVVFDIVIIATGILHQDEVKPEKSLRQLAFDPMNEVFAINTMGPALLAKHFLPRLNRERKSVFACLSARVGSISDNRLGGWYAYRASKAALNMILKTAAIEVARRNRQACVIGLHPGTVDTALSKPYQSAVREKKLFTPEYSVACLIEVINRVTPDQSGSVFAWDGAEVPA